MSDALRAAHPDAAVEILWRGMPVWRTPAGYVPDPDLFSREDAEAGKWIGKPAKFRRDVEDYWFHVYKPEPGDTIVDIGAGRGEDVFAFSSAVGPTGTVWAIEPHPVSYAALELLCSLNGLTNVRAFRYACVDVPRALEIETLRVWESNYVREGPASASSHSVTGIRFDDFLREQAIARIDFLKMNIEGAERMALPGCREALRMTRTVCVAAHDFRADRGEGEEFRTLELVKDALSSAGFDLIQRNDTRYYVPYHVHGVRRS